MEAMTKCFSLAAGLIHPSSSPARAGFFFVDKTDKLLNPCIDYRGLNDNTIKIRYSLPLISSAFELLKDAKIFTKLDLRNTEGDEWKTTFNIPSGHYKYHVMPFGLTSAPAAFQALVNDINSEIFLNCSSLFTWTISSSFLLTKRLSSSMFVMFFSVSSTTSTSWKLKSVSSIYVSSVAVQGFIISEDNIQLDPVKDNAVTEWPTPTTCKQL